MSREVRIVLIALGALFGVLLICAVAAVFTLPKLAQRFVGGDAQSRAAVNAKIAKFSVPRGYRESAAVDMLFATVAVITPEQRQKRFAIQLQALQLPPSAVPPKEDDSQLITGMKFGLAQQCTGFQDAGTEDIDVLKKPVTFRIVTCDNGKRHLRAEVGNFAAISPYVTVLAVGSDHDFDAKALRELLASIH